jgi:hypothetical protein
MKILKTYLYVVAVAFGVLISSCSRNDATTEVEVKAMDSVSTELEKSNKQLDDQAKKVEASLEKIDQELNAAN